MLNYERYEHKKDNENFRNGYCKTKKVQTRYGAIEIKTPRDRNGKFEDIVLSLCAKGMSYQDISSLLKEIYGVDISKDQVQTFVDTITEVVDNWRNRPLKSFYAFIYADCLYIPVTEDLKSEKKAFYVIIGVNAQSIKKCWEFGVIKQNLLLFGQLFLKI